VNDAQWPPFEEGRSRGITDTRHMPLPCRRPVYMGLIVCVCVCVCVFVCVYIFMCMCGAPARVFSNSKIIA